MIKQTTTAIAPKFKVGDRVVDDVNNPDWAAKDRLDSLIKYGTVVEYRILPGTTGPLVPFIKWDKGAPGYVREESLKRTTKPAPSCIVENSTEDSTDITAQAKSPGLARLAQLEELIESARRQAQRAAFEIKEDRLWEEAGYSSFVDYCSQRWGWQKSHAYDQAIAGGTINQLLDSGIPESQIPESTSALTAIAQAPEPQQATVLQETQAREGAVTAAGIRRTLKHTPSYELMVALFSQIGIVTTPTASQPEKLTVTGPLFESGPLKFDTVKEAQQYWELNAQRLCAIAINQYTPDPEIKRSLCHVPCKLVSTARSKEVGRRGSLMGDWAADAKDPRGQQPTPWDYPFMFEGSPYLRAIHLFQVQIAWEDTCGWKPTEYTSQTRSSLPSAPVSTQKTMEIYQLEDQRGQEKSAIAQQIPVMAPFPTGAHSLIVADPPWRYHLRETDSSHRGRTPYPTMSDEEILSLPMAQLAEEDAYLLLWTTNAHLPLALDCLAVWGFEYKAIHTWVKQNGETGKTQLGLGHYGRNCTEHFLVGMRGKPGAWSSLGITDMPNVILQSRQEHSRKPSQFWQLAQALSVKLEGDAIELFARGDRADCQRQRAGWHTWGLEA